MAAHFIRNGTNVALFPLPVHITEEEERSMSKELRFVFSLLAFSLLAAAVWALPATDSRAQQDPPKATAPQAESQTVSGTVASVSSGSFTLTIGSGFYYDEPGQTDKGGKTMAFSTDKNTTVDGTLKVGAQADVTYRVEDGKNIAISVRVAS
jgi:hypothetical protein